MKRIFNQTIARQRVGTLFAPLALCAALLLDLPCPARAAAPETSSSAVSNAHTGPRSTDISAFNLITERNIFNTRRSARYVPSSRRDSRRARQPDAFALVGTLIYNKGPLAFFDGNRSEFRKAAKPGDMIAGFKVLDIESSFVKLASPTNQIEMKLGMQLQHEENGGWDMTVRPESAEPSAPSLYSRITYRTNSASTNIDAAAAFYNGYASGLANAQDQGFPPPEGAPAPEAGQPPEGGAPPPPGETGESEISNNAAPPSQGGENDVLLRLMRRRNEQENNQ